MQADMTSLSELPKEVTDRLNLWTGDAARHSANVLQLARHRVRHSNSYLLGDVNPDGHGLGVSFVASEVQVPNPANSFRLQWHKCVLKNKSSLENNPSDEEYTLLTKLYLQESLKIVKNHVKNNFNYQQQPERYPSTPHLRGTPYLRSTHNAWE
ncbi:hypothetical protein GNI_180900 [Gregarina niphandrodes]|uniref:Uncharacterized protein n=1 Tax=Gregarina niphandrodes TaxID=110365 RepID=A0A023AXB3_GRENI|nr:hypothetical protein GNI_180900 [Gregarina niphandrodes]EZG43237.1 hypothetical protein GNI_180900 [Gregarina niphandrodes]|eukprot:XP_011133505.1 hypothetical protein GNI_180900 [Gregarina niphandrodes]